ncbi:MAG: hypothetical protein ACOY4K_14155 [Pseudomonadota bacterium]
MKFTLSAVAVATLLCVSSAVAEETTPPPAAEPAPTVATDKRDPNERICKTKPVIGSRVPVRTCMTRAEWEARAKADKEMLDDATRRGLSTCATKPCGG